MTQGKKRGERKKINIYISLDQGSVLKAKKTFVTFNYFYTHKRALKSYRRESKFPKECVYVR